MTFDAGLGDNSLSLIQNSNYSNLFKQAEEAIKLVEHRHSNLIIPAINELRYAGYHISLYVRNPEKKEEIRKACGHCQRATYDAYEASILFCVEEFDAFKEDYKDCTITEVIPDYINKIRAIKKAIAFIDSIDKETRANDYEQCKKHHEELIEIVESLNEARSELNKKIKAERKAGQFLWATLILGVVVLFATIVFGVLPYCLIKNDSKTSDKQSVIEHEIKKDIKTEPIASGIDKKG